MQTNITLHLVVFLLNLFSSFNKKNIFISIGSCFLDTSYVYNTEAHPIDIGSLDCCISTYLSNENLSKNIQKDLLVKKRERHL